jgi:hypothetical protein
MKKLNLYLSQVVVIGITRMLLDHSMQINFLLVLGLAGITSFLCLLIFPKNY